MVDVAHDHHDRRTRHEIFISIFRVVKQDVFFRNLHQLIRCDAVFSGDQGCGVEIDFLVERGHDAQLHQALDHFRSGLLDRLGKFLDRQGSRKLDMGQDGADHTRRLALIAS